MREYKITHRNNLKVKAPTHCHKQPYSDIKIMPRDGDTIMLCYDGPTNDRKHSTTHKWKIYNPKTREVVVNLLGPDGGSYSYKA